MRAAPLLLSLLVLSGCLGGGSDWARAGDAVAATPEGDAPAPADLVDANAAFAVRLVGALHAEAPRANLVVSPFSVSVALAMALEGANGTTRERMARTLGVDADRAAEQFRDLLLNVSRPQRNVTLRVADAMWIDEPFAPRVSEGYKETVTDAFFADLLLRDFRDAGTVDDINAWASARTDGRIPRVLDRIEPDVVMYLMNAVYFKGTWMRPFKEECTRDADFTRADGSVVRAPMMCGMPDEAPTYAQGRGVAVARLPYEGDRHALYVVLPDRGAPLAQTLATLDPSLLDAATEGNVRVQMPRVALKTHADLAATLSGLGMGVAFTDQADFTRIAPSLMLGRVLHDAVMDVDELGTVAAAVTTVEVMETSAPPPPFAFTVDRPYALVLRDDASGTWLFVALVHDPTA